jgi:predicted phosphodiesterase
MTARDITAQAPLLLFGGPYSNLRALTALRELAAARGFAPARVICTGDVVAYCAEPEETVAEIRDWGCHVVAGNCEEQLAAGGEDCGCGFEEGSACDLLAKGWYPFARARVSPASAAWMATLPSALTFRLAGARCRVVHGGVSETSRFLFGSQPAALEAEVAAAGADVVIGGHCGIPFAHVFAGGGRAWLNPGVIGMPANDGTPDGWYGVLDVADDGLVFTTHRLAYDAAGAAAAMRRHGHANGYARTLITGIWPSFDVLPQAERDATGLALSGRCVRLRTSVRN